MNYKKSIFIALALISGYANCSSTAIETVGKETNADREQLWKSMLEPIGKSSEDDVKHILGIGKWMVSARKSKSEVIKMLEEASAKQVDSAITIKLLQRIKRAVKRNNFIEKEIIRILNDVRIKYKDELKKGDIVHIWKTCDGYRGALERPNYDYESRSESDSTSSKNNKQASAAAASSSSQAASSSNQAASSSSNTQPKKFTCNKCGRAFNDPLSLGGHKFGCSPK